MTRPLRRVPLALTCLALCAALLAGCGGGDEGDAGARQILAQTFGASASAIENGRLNVDFQLDPEGLLALGGPIKLTLNGPFSASRPGDLPRFDVDFAATLARQRFDGNARSTGRQAFVTLDDRTYKVDDPFVARLRRGLGDTASGKQRPQGGLDALGIEPLRWISGAQEKGNERIAGVDTIRVGANVNVARLLEDVDRLLTRAGGSARGTGSLLTPALRKQIAGAVDSAKVDIWTGASDKLLRQLAVVITFAFKDGAASPIPGLEAGTIRLRLRLDDVNATRNPFTITPQRARPLSALTGGSPGNFLDGLGAGLTGGSGAALLACITGADGRTASLVRCVSQLAG